jgi:hypothetical protein
VSRGRRWFANVQPAHGSGFRRHVKCPGAFAGFPRGTYLISPPGIPTLGDACLCGGQWRSRVPYSTSANPTGRWRSLSEPSRGRILPVNDRPIMRRSAPVRNTAVRCAPAPAGLTALLSSIARVDRKTTHAIFEAFLGACFLPWSRRTPVENRHVSRHERRKDTRYAGWTPCTSARSRTALSPPSEVADWVASERCTLGLPRSRPRSGSGSVRSAPDERSGRPGAMGVSAGPPRIVG